MTEENATMLEKIQKVLRSCSSIIEQGAKPFAVFIATIYIIGYIVISFHLAQYGVPIKSLIDAQYFAAGLLPGLLLWFTICVTILAWNFNPRRTDKSHTPKLKWLLANVLVGISIVVLIKFPEILSSKLFTVGLLFIFPLGELSLWILIVIFRKGFRYWLAEFSYWLAISWHPIRMLREGYKKISIGTLQKEIESLARIAKLTAYQKVISLLNAIEYLGKIYLKTYVLIFLLVILFFYFVFLIYFSFFALILVPFSGPLVYEQIPQAYGGGKLQPVQLYVDSQKIPSELLDANVSLAQGLPARTIPLNLIYQSSTEYIVIPIGQSDHRAWQLKADAVYAVVENP